jgi:hypothetical protein
MRLAEKGYGMGFGAGRVIFAVLIDFCSYVPLFERAVQQICRYFRAFVVCLLLIGSASQLKCYLLVAYWRGRFPHGIEVALLFCLVCILLLKELFSKVVTCSNNINLYLFGCSVLNRGGGRGGWER